MSKSLLPMPIALAATLLLCAPAALAAGAGTTAETGAEHATKAEIAAFEHVKVALPQAISAAEKHAHGKALDASFEDKNGKPDYAVKTYQNNAVWEGKVDANSGQVTGQGKTTPESALDQEDKAEIKGLQQAKTTLADAVGTAEHKVGGKAIDAGLEASHGKVAYEVQVVKNGAVQMASVDPQNGRLAAERGAPIQSGGAMSGSSMPEHHRLTTAQAQAREKAANAETHRLNEQQLNLIEDQQQPRQ